IKVRMVEVGANFGIEYGLEYAQDRSERTSFLKSLNAMLNPKNYLDAQKPGSVAFQGLEAELKSSGRHLGTAEITLRALQEAGETKIISCPDILVIEGQSATLHTGSQVPYQQITVTGANTQYSTGFKDIGAQLTVNANFVGNDSAVLQVKPQVSSLTGWTDPSQVGGISNPMISTRRCETTVTVRDQETLVIGGLLEDKKLLTRRSVPLLGSIPILKYIFSSVRNETETTQLIFFLTIEIISPSKPANSPRILEPDVNQGNK
ncbi:MAG: type II and III secretion system protein, partial [Planctomycetota bacterium]